MDDAGTAPSLAVHARSLGLAGIPNFRDYGGYAAGGGRLREGRLWRSAQHRCGTPEDLARIAGLELASVYDLRGDHERVVAPCPRGPGFAARVVFADEPTPEPRAPRAAQPAAAQQAPHVAAGAAAMTAEEAHAVMAGSYARMPFQPRLIEVFAAYLTGLATEEGPSLIHCMAGKDRTGIAVGVFHSLMGVHRDDIIADYLLTNADPVEVRIQASGPAFQNAFRRQLPYEVLAILASVEPAYLDAALAAIAQECGSIEGYVTGPLGLSPGIRDQIAERLIV